MQVPKNNPQGRQRQSFTLPHGFVSNGEQTAPTFGQLAASTFFVWNITADGEES